jgi:hypothetical protein
MDLTVKNYAPFGAGLRTFWGKSGKNYAPFGAKLRTFWGKHTTQTTTGRAFAFPIAIYSYYSYL